MDKLLLFIPMIHTTWILPAGSNSGVELYLTVYNLSAMLTLEYLIFIAPCLFINPTDGFFTLPPAWKAITFFLLQECEIYK